MTVTPYRFAASGNYRRPDISDRYFDADTQWIGRAGKSLCDDLLFSI
jgi:hypothetical protein